MNLTEKTIEPTIAASSRMKESSEGVIFLLGCIVIFFCAVLGTIIFDKKQQKERSIQRMNLIMRSLVIQLVGKENIKAKSTGACKNDTPKTGEHGDHTEEKEEECDVENPIVGEMKRSTHKSQPSAIQRWKQEIAKVAPLRNKQCRPAEGSSTNLEEEDSDSGDVCPICIMPFEVGEEIGLSKNPECDHVFHAKCLKPWLMMHRNCPCCRLDYLSWGEEKQKLDSKKDSKELPHSHANEQQCVDCPIVSI